MRPEVLVLDEPAAGLDPYSRKEMLDLIRMLHKETGMTVIIVSHSMEDMAEYVDRLIVMNKGSIMYDDIPSNVFKYEEKLKRIGLDVPESAKLINRLRDYGYLIPDSDFSIEDTTKVIARYMMEM